MRLPTSKAPLEDAPGSFAQSERPSASLAELARQIGDRPRPLHDILRDLGPQGPALLALLLALPFPLPGSLPGVGTAFGVIIASLGCAMVTGRFRWPERGPLARPVGGPLLSKLLALGVRLLGAFERLTRARWRFAAATPPAWRAAGISVALLGVMLALPLPPGTNSPPAMGIILLILGLLTRDGLFTMGGHLVAAAHVAALGAIGVFGFDAVRALMMKGG
jgi:hypothetical protein